MTTNTRLSTFTGIVRDMGILCAVFLANAGMASAREIPVPAAEIFRLLTDQRMIYGMVEDSRGQEIRVNIGNVMPRFLSLKQAGDKHQTTPQVGDLLVLVINNQNNVIEYHLSGEERWHTFVHGKLLKTFPEDPAWVLIQFPNEEIKVTPIDEPAREKIAALPVGLDATFILDATHAIIDVKWES
ncbi:MAG TPA: hypothetical protein PKZ24_11315 [Nitrospirales bacterium]|nr:hypothetical protein [Nitrospirales bacterium]